MRPVIRYQSRLLIRKSYKPNRIIRTILLPKPTLVFRPMHHFVTKRRSLFVP